MHRTRIQSVMRAAMMFALIVLCSLCMYSGRALAFHSGSLFDALPGQGGAGGIFFTGAPTERGWNCTACHTNSEGKINANLTTMPAGLFENQRYTPNQAYVVTVKLIGEHRGKSSSRSNFNGFNIAFLDGKNQGVGRISGYAPDEYYAPNNYTLATAGKQVGTTSWTFTFTAPPAGTGPITVYLAMVDGNGADSPPTQTLTDPFGDDVVVLKLVLNE